jgi:hypothetical protein
MTFHKMKPLRIKLKKVIALFMLFTLLNQMFAPMMAYALTAGPTAPEATNFEPIDTTDMVNPLTGSFTYSVPLLEVPGPEGGYPLALSYHAGIQPDEEASWVGLGWSLNPGAIARNVNGYPDDWSGAGGTMLNNWAGGSQSTYSIGVNIGLGGSPASVNVGLSFSSDTYRGFGVGMSFGVGIEFGNSPFSLGPQIGVSPYGEGYAGVDVNYSAGAVGNTGLNSSVGIGLQTNFHSLGGSLSGGVGNSSSSAVGVSISTSNIRPSFSVGGGAITSVNDVNKGKISTSSNGFFIPIPIVPGVVSLSLGYQNVRYWSSTSSGFTANGVLNNRSSINSTDDLNTIDDDNYSILDPNIPFVDYPDPREQLGGTYPNFDNYSVTAQGLGGNIRPYIFSSVLFHQNRINNSDHTNDVYGESLPLNPAPPTLGKKWQFRFINDLSNSYREQQPWTSDQSYNFDQNPVYGNSDGVIGYSPATNRLEGSNHIEYFTNADINNGNAALRGFIDCDETGGFSRSNPNQVGGFMITNASGVTYHYALPAYSNQEVAYTQSKDGSATNSIVKNTPYAYTWYLTAITGPDYVSRGTLGVISNNDWGYWVKFVYGKWTGNYEWRTPGIGFTMDIDNNFKSCSSGVKEVYYLDAIKTRTHTALFVKDIRSDAKSYGAYSGVPTSASNYDGSSVPSLNLNSILLVKNDQFTSTISSIRNAGNLIGTNANSANVIDVSDLNALPESLGQKCLRKIALNYDNSLCPGAPNSFTPQNNLNKLGKLTLLSVDFQGKGGTPMTPPIEFQYDLDPADPGNNDNITITSASANQAGTNQPGTIRVGSPGKKFKTGDIVTFTINAVTYYCTLISTTDNTNFKVLFLNNSPGTGSINTVIAGRKTKNPPYNNDTHDLWSCYKSDYKANSNNENLARLTSNVSNMSTDVWSMRRIVSSLGANININYEGATYNKSVLNKNRSLIFLGGQTNTTRNGVRNYTFTADPSTPDLTNIFNVGDKTSMIYMMYRFSTNQLATVNSEAQSKTPLIVTAVTPSKLTLNVSAEMDQDINSYIDGFQTANVVANGNNQLYGGGIRVKDLIVDDLNGNITKTSYDYAMPSLPGGQIVSSGVTSYEPLVFDADNLPAVRNRLGNTYSTDVLEKAYRRELYKLANKILAIAREVPPPGVMYEYVTVRDSNILANGTRVPIDGKTTYQYEVFKSEMVGIYDYHDLNGLQPASGAAPVVVQNHPTVITGQAKKDRTIKDYTSRIGNLRRVITYDDRGNKLTEKINHYLHDDLDNTSFQNQMNNYDYRLYNYNGVAYNYIGVIKERYGNSRFLVRSYSSQRVSGESFLMMSNKETFPTIQTGTTQIDYKNGTRMDQTNLAYDFYTGGVTKTLTTDSYGNRFINQVTPAYLAGNGVYLTFGLKTHDDELNAIQHKHMLTQEASNYTFTADNNNNPIGVLTASVQTWSTGVPVLDPDDNATTVDQANGVWRKEKNISWMAAGSAVNNLTPYSSFVDYYASGGSSNASWKTTGQITQYSAYSAALEAQDINANYASTRMGYSSSKVIITGSPAKYNEIAYAGAEDAFLGNHNFSCNIVMGTGTVVVDSTNAHTGTNSLKVPAGSFGFSYSVPVTTLNSGRSYHVSVWVKPMPGNSYNLAQLYYTVNGSTITPTQTYTKTASNWCLLEMTVPSSAVNGDRLSVGCKNASAADLYFDDFRFQPISASVNAYVYDNKTGELTYVLDNNNLFTRYQYDAIGRLVRTYKEVLGKTKAPIVNAVRYHYQGKVGLN